MIQQLWKCNFVTCHQKAKRNKAPTNEGVHGELSDEVATEGVSSDGGADAGGGGLLVKSARSFLKRMTKAFAGGGGNRDGGAGGADAWDAAQTVIMFRWTDLKLLICALKGYY